MPPLQCAQCHTNGNYNLQIAATDCANSGCHQTDWQNTNNPVHSAAGTTFAAANCSNCHTTANPFTTTSWNHTSTGWTLVGNHQMSPAGVVTNCNQCHVGNNYNLTVTDCYNSGCHTADWNSTATLGGAVPNHVAAQFPTSMCSTCHDTLYWADGKFDHSTTGWALTGGHVVPTAGRRAGLHRLPRQQQLFAHFSEHRLLRLPCDAVEQHANSRRVYPEPHCRWISDHLRHLPHHHDLAGRRPSTTQLLPDSPSRSPSACNDCHQVSTDYSNFTCINCHTTTAHQQTQTVNQHNGVNEFRLRTRDLLQLPQKRRRGLSMRDTALVDLSVLGSRCLLLGRYFPGPSESASLQRQPATSEAVTSFT